MPKNENITSFITSVNWDGLPDNVKKRARMCLIDNLGVTLAGTLTNVSRISARVATEVWGGKESTILLHNLKASAPGAAFANACAANALDLDDDAIFTRGHPGAQLFPAVLAVAEASGASGKEFLEALVVGYEVAIRTGRCWHDYHLIYQACGSWGSVACAAAAAHILKLDSEQILNALGIAEYHSPNAPMMRDIESPSMVKHAIGWGAMNGVTSAMLAKAGYTGMPSILNMETYQDWLADLGDKYWMADWIFYKDWASCAWGHAAGVAALQLIDKERISTDEIEKVIVKTFQEGVSLFKGLPTTTEEAQFSLKWPLACLMLDRELGPDQVLEKRLCDPAVIAIMNRIEVVCDPLIDGLYREAKEMDLRMHSSVTIRLKDGRRYDSGVVERKADRYSESDLETKFRKLTGRFYDFQHIDKLIRMTRHFEALEDVRSLVALLDLSGLSPAEKFT